MMSLANQNEYLLKKIKAWEDKEEQFNKKVAEINQTHSKEIKELAKVKDAFARKYEEMKADNIVLTETAADYKQQLV